MWFVAIKHIFSRKKQTVLTFIGIVIGAAGYVIFSGIMLGFQEYIIERLVNSDGHIKISARDEYITETTLNKIFYEDSEKRWLNEPSGRKAHTRLTNVTGWYNKLDASPEVVAYAPQISREVIFNHGGFSKVGGFIGIDPDAQLIVTTLGENITNGKLSDVNSGGPTILIGEGLMKRLGAKVNDTLFTANKDGVISPVKIVGTFLTGVRTLDDRCAYASITSVQKITQSSGEISRIIVKVKDVTRSAGIATSWNKFSRDYVESWDQANKNFLSMMSTQNIVRNSTIITLILIVAFGIYNILNMVVTQKRRDIAILRSIGFTERDTIFLFLMQGLILSVIGAVLGLIIGGLACAYIETIKIPRGVGHMIVSWDILIYIKSFLLIVGSSTIASFLPAKTAGRLSPIDIIRGSI